MNDEKFSFKGTCVSCLGQLLLFKRVAMATKFDRDVLVLRFF